jgi:enamine deaminase RidA (YjgF/YER057c/UK114 family)
MARFTTTTNSATGVTRHGVFTPEEGDPPLSGPIISQVVTRGDTVYLCGVITPEFGRNPGNPQLGDVRSQTRQVLQRIDELLAEAGSDKSKLLTVQVWLADMGVFAEHNDEWNAWVDRDNPPVRACVEARLAHPALLVEIMVTAAR